MKTYTCELTEAGRQELTMDATTASNDLAQQDLAVCRGCGDPIEAEDEVGEFLGSPMHRLCAIEERICRIEDAVFNDKQGYEAVSLFTRRVEGLKH